MNIKRLKECHPRLNVLEVRTLKALYRGGKSLLRDKEILNEVFPPYMFEREGVYQERCKRAFYEPVLGQVINQISAHLAQDPVVLAGEEGVELDEYWTEIQKCATPPGDMKKSLDEIIRDSCVEGLVTGWAWLQCDLPPATVTDGVRELSEKEQEDSGALRAYFVQWPTQAVTDWEEKDGKLLWVRTYTCEMNSYSPEQSRDVKTHTWTIWNAESATKYEIVESKDKSFPQNEEEVIEPVEVRPHTFGRVPWVRFDTYQREGKHLHVADALKSLCVAYFNRQNGESFQWTQFCYQQLYEFLAPEVAGIDAPVSEAQQDPGRAKRTRSPGQVHVRGAEDRAEFVGPDMAGAEVGRNATADMRDAILRVINMMALSQDSSGAMLGRSADSKKQDGVAQEVLVGAIGKILIVFVHNVIDLAQTARQDEAAPIAEGYQKFDATDPDQLINQSVLVESITIPSARYQIEQKYQLAVAHLGDAATPEIREEIREQLEGAITQDQLDQAMVPPDPFAPVDEDGNPIEEEEEEEEPFEPDDRAPNFRGKKVY